MSINTVTVIRTARIIDGTGAPERTGDVGIEDGRIVALSPNDSDAISAEHVHAIGPLPESPAAPPPPRSRRRCAALWQGVCQCA